MKHHVRLIEQRGPGYVRSRVAAFSVALTMGLALSVSATAVLAKGGTEEEKAAGAACLKQICAAIKAGDAASGPISCDLSRKWTEEEISHEVEKKLKVDWTLGSATCGVKLTVESASVTKALGSGENVFKIPAQPVKCDLQRKETVYPVKFTLSPSLTLKDGVSTKAQLGIADIEAPGPIKAVLWSASKLDSTFSAFEGGIVKSVNKFLKKGCKKLEQ